MRRGERGKYAPSCVRRHVKGVLTKSKAPHFARYDGSDAALAAVAAIVQGLGEKETNESEANIISTWWLTRTSLFFDHIS